MPPPETDRYFQIRPDRRELLIDGTPVAVGARAFDVLHYLSQNTGRVVGKQELLDQVWEGVAVEEGNLAVQISALRKALGARAISTVPGVGYQLAAPDDALAPLQNTDPPPLPTAPSLAVLPFTNLTGDPENAYLVDGIVMDLIGSLSRIAGLFVIAATSSFAYKGKLVCLEDVGTDLGVRYVLEGSIQKSGQQVRISVQLVETETSHTIWSDRFTGEEAEIFALQDHLVERVAATLEPNLLRAERLRIADKPTTDLGAYDLCLQVTPAMLHLKDRARCINAIETLKRALALDPGYARAKALICRMNMLARSARWITLEQAQTCLPYAEDVLTEHRNDALALAFAGHAIAFLGRQRERGMHITRQAMALNPNSSHVLNASGWVHSYALENDTAIDHFTRCLRISPLDELNGQVRTGLGIAHLHNGQITEGLSVIERANAEAPEYGSIYISLVWGHWLAGHLDEVERFGKKMLERDPGMTISGHFENSPYKPDPAVMGFADALRHLGVPE